MRVVEVKGARMTQGRKPYGEPLTEEQILAWADAHYTRTGQWPHNYSGAVAGVPGQSWAAINQALGEGFRGLPGGDSLAKLLDRRERKPLHWGRPWTPEEDQLVRDLPAKEAARQTERTLVAVNHRRRALGIARSRRRRT
jgi:hypothetical protein